MLAARRPFLKTTFYTAIVMGTCLLYACIDDASGDDGNSEGNDGFSGVQSGDGNSPRNPQDAPDFGPVTDATDFRVIVKSVEILPFKPETGEPWDWDGDIPDALIDAVDTLALLSGNGAVYGEILRQADEIAPELLEGTVPPDVFITFEHYDPIEDETVDTRETRVVSDTLTPTFADALFEVSFLEGDVLIIQFIDKDLAFDDDIATFLLDLETLQSLAGNEWAFEGPDPLFPVRSMVIEVEAFE